MDSMLSEIMEIPARGQSLLDGGPAYNLPTGVPYIGMGSSYFAPLAFKYIGVDIYPELASEFFSYVKKGKNLSNGVILSQSGKSTECLWCTKMFDEYVAVTNDVNSELATNKKAKAVIDIMAGNEQSSSSKTYTNTLLTLFKGFGINPAAAWDVLVEKMKDYERKGEEMANQVYDILEAEDGDIHGIYITGSGPNIATAMEAALILSETSKRNFHGLPMAQYDHGPKETAAKSIVIQILSKGDSYNRTLKLSDTIRQAGAHVLSVQDNDVSENLSILNNILPFNFMAYYLSKKLKIGETFSVGGKITEVL
jgi:glucosamine--fructose-6-phosphate aminotransferase (isomerizing)